jgi:segregation and condensation protein A
MQRAELFSHHRVQRETLSLRERMSAVLERLHREGFSLFSELFDLSEGRSGVVVTFLAVLELLRAALIELVQAEAFAPIHVRAAGA